jgi:ATP-binding cassette, subfamily C (CFTR/MRP), member 1
MIVLESSEKRSFLVHPYNKLSRENISGTYSRSIFFWLNSLFLSGYRKVLSIDDLYPLDPALETEKLQLPLQAAWENGKYIIPNFALDPY